MPSQSSLTVLGLNHSSDAEILRPKPQPIYDRPIEANEKPAHGPGRTLKARISAFCVLRSDSERHAYAAEQYRIMRTKIASALKKPLRLVITSPNIGDGKTSTAINLAAVMALRSEDRTLLIDADMRRARVHGALDVPQSPGLTEVLRGECRIEDAMFSIEGLPGLCVLTAGKSDGNPTELLDSAAWRELVAGASRRFPAVIIDSSPVDVVADHDLIAAVCDGEILVVRPDHTDRSLALAAIERLKPKLTGIVVNAADGWSLGHRHKDHKYYYSSPAR